MGSYLSIDVDYFNHTTSYQDKYSVENELGTLLNTCVRNNIPVIAVMNHQQMLPYVDSSKANSLINIDTHADLTDSFVNFLDCGTWVSYVSWRKRGSYTWIRAQRGYKEGNCNRPFKWNTGTDWGSTEAIRHTTSINQFLLGDCVGVGLCMSPAYSFEEWVLIFRRLVKEFRIPYIKGDLTENKRVNRSPR